MRSMLIGCALLVFGSCAAFAQQDPSPMQGGSPNAPAAAVPTGAQAPAMAPMAAPAGDAMMHKPMMHHAMHHRGMMHHKKMMRHHRSMMMHHKKMMMMHKKMMHHRMHKNAM